MLAETEDEVDSVPSTREYLNSFQRTDEHFKKTQSAL